MNSQTLLAFIGTSSLLLTGCAAGPSTLLPPSNLPIECQLKIIQSNADGVPTRIQVTYKNHSDTPVTITLPDPLPDGFTSTPPHSFLGVLVADPSGSDVDFAFTDTTLTNHLKPTRTTLQPGKIHTAEYDLHGFYRWGPCGPDKSTNFVSYWNGRKPPTTIQAIWEPDATLDKPRFIMSNIHHLAASNDPKPAARMK